MTPQVLPAFLTASSQSSDRPSSTTVNPNVPVRKANRRSWRSHLIRGLVLLSLVGLVGAGWYTVRSGRWKSESPTLHFPMASVAKADLSTILTASGRVESSQNTVIACELERLDVRAGSQMISSGGASTILELVEEGKEVKAGEVLCLLDGSEYEEIVVTQEIKTLQAEAALRQAELNLEVARIAVLEYGEGLHQQNLQSMNGLIFLARSDLERAEDRLQWTLKMLEKGYLPVAKKTEATQTRNQTVFDLESYLIDRDNYLKYGNNRTKMELDAEVEKRRFEVIANTQRVTRSRERLAHYKRMVELCTIRAPHDGFLIYAVDPNRPSALPIEAGQTVRQAQKLFYLPDLSKMQIMAYLHESVATRVHEGMRVKARIEGLANRELEGHVISVAPIPTTAGNWISNEVKYFVGVVKLDSAPNGIRPGMSAEVEFDVDRCLDVLAVPTEAIACEQGRNICYVAGVDGLERRSVTLGRSTRDMLEVTKGLAEGEQVVLRPEKIDAIDSLVVHSDKEATPEAVAAASEQVPVATAPISVD